MPAKHQMDPTSRNTRVLEWYKAHPGFHRCVSVAQALGESTHDIAAASWTLNQRGYLDRHRLSVAGRTTPITHYGIAATYVSPGAGAKNKEPQPA